MGTENELDTRAPDPPVEHLKKGPAAPTPACWRTSSSRTWIASHPWSTWRRQPRESSSTAPRR